MAGVVQSGAKMSFTSAYSELRALVNDEPADRPPRILDRDGFNDVPSHVEMSESTFEKISVLGEETDQTEYPERTWETLKGFKTHTPAGTFLLDLDIDTEDIVQRIKSQEDRERAPLGYWYNIERMGISYGGIDGEWRYFFAEISRHTEPFAFYHSSQKVRFPDLTDFADGEETVYYIECDDGDLYAEEQTFERTSTEVLIDGD